MKRKSESKAVFIAIIGIIIIAALIIVPPVMKAGDIISAAGKHPDLIAYSNNASYAVSVKQLSEQDIDILTAQLPLIYSGMPAGIYQITYKGQDTAIALYDDSLDKVVKFYVE